MPEVGLAERGFVNSRVIKIARTQNPGDQRCDVFQDQAVSRAASGLTYVSFLSGLDVKAV